MSKKPPLVVKPGPKNTKGPPPRRDPKRLKDRAVTK